MLHYIGVYAQDATAVQIYLEDFKKATDDSSRCYALWQASFNSAHSDAKQGVRYGIQALSYAEKLGSKKLKADSYNSIGYCYDSSGQSDSA